MVKVRFCSKPHRLPTLGGARTALFNWMYARSRAGCSSWRIEDTDRERSGRSTKRSPGQHDLAGVDLVMGSTNKATVFPFTKNTLRSWWLKVRPFATGVRAFDVPRPFDQV